MEELFSLSTMQAIVLMGSISAGIELAKRALDKDWRTVATIVIAGIIGAIVGSTYCGLAIPEGVIYGLSATGLFNFAQNLGSHVSTKNEEKK